MCGIFVIKGFEKSRSEIQDILIGGLISRGPDSTFIVNQNNVTLGQTILSFSRGEQVHNHREHISDDGRFIVLLNGEIYNWKKVASQLKISCQSDIELISKLLSYALDDVSMIMNLIEGMFIIVVFDQLKNEIKVIRDSVGEKNAYYYYSDKKLIISSILNPFKDLLSDIELNIEHLKSYFFTRHLLSAYETSFKNIYRFEPGSITTFDLNKSTIEVDKKKKINKYIDLEYFNYLNNLPEEQFLKHSEEIFISSAKKILINSRKVGSICSGGVDSSIASYYINKNCQNLETVALVFPGKDEQARLFNEKQDILNSKLLEVTSGLFLENMIEAYRIVHGPLPTHSFPSQLIISNYAKSLGIVNLITGDGGDEFYGGYSAYENSISCRTTPSIYSNYDNCDEVNLSFENNLREKINNEWKIAVESYNFLDKESAALQSMLLMDSGLQLESTALLSSDLLTSSLGMESRGFYLTSECISLALNMPIKYKLQKIGLHRYSTRPFMRGIYKNKFNMEALPKQGFSGYPEVSEKYLIDNYKNPFEKVEEIFKFKVGNLHSYAKSIQWKILNLSMFFNLK